MTPSDASSFHYLTQKPKTFLDDFYRRDDDEFEHPSRLKDLRELIQMGKGSPEILGKDRFKFSITGQDFSAAVCKRVFYASVRVAKLCAALKALETNKGAAAWMLTTCYYSSYFAALEILFLDGRFTSYVDGEDIEAIVTLSPVTDHKIKKGSYECEVVWSEADETVTVFFAYASDKPHKFAWEKMKQYVDGLGDIPPRSLSQIKMLKRVLGSGGDRWRFPSETRNIWNYKESPLFATEGEVRSREFKATCCKPSEAVKWASRGPKASSEEGYATSIAYLKAVLVGAYMDLARTVLPPKKFAEIAKIGAS